MPPPVSCVLRDSHVNRGERAAKRRWHRNPNAVSRNEQHRALSAPIERPYVVARPRIPQTARVGHGVRGFPIADDAEDDPVLRGVGVGNRHRQRPGAVDDCGRPLRRTEAHCSSRRIGRGGKRDQARLEIRGARSGDSEICRIPVPDLR